MTTPRQAGPQTPTAQQESTTRRPGPPAMTDLARPPREPRVWQVRDEDYSIDEDRFALTMTTWLGATYGVAG